VTTASVLATGMPPKAHVLVGIVTVSSLLFIVRMVRRRQLRAKYSLLWLSVGVGITLLAIGPSILDNVSHRLGIDYPPTTFLLVAVTFLFLVAVHFSWELSRLEERNRALAEEVALLRMAVGPPPRGDERDANRA
jgi:hypothetical protein